MSWVSLTRSCQKFRHPSLSEINVVLDTLWMCAHWNDQNGVRNLFSCSTFIICDPPSPLVISTDEIMSTVVWALSACRKSHPILSIWGERHEESQLQGSLCRVIVVQRCPKSCPARGWPPLPTAEWGQGRTSAGVPGGQEGCTGNDPKESDTAPWGFGSTHKTERQPLPEQ